MEWFADVAAFLVKGGLVLAAVLIVLAMIGSLIRSARQGDLSLSVTNLNDRYESFAEILRFSTQSKKEYKKDKKRRTKAEKKKDDPERSMFVVDFEGDLMASEADSLREQVSAILSVAAKDDEVMVRLDSPGGVVNGYGFAASQLSRFRRQGIKLTVCVDRMAASGGYLMACVADKILASPFAIIGSIGVVASVPNLHRLLKKNDIDYEEMTAGEYKRTVSMLGEITDKGREKFQEQLENTHDLFRRFVAQHREGVNIDEVATGEYWFASQALDLGLIDEIQTSDDHIMEALQTTRIRLIELERPKSLKERVSGATSSAFDTVWSRLEQKNLESNLV